MVKKIKSIDAIFDYPSQKNCFDLAILQDDVVGAVQFYETLYDNVTLEVGSAKEDAIHCDISKRHLQCPFYDVFMKAKWTETYLRMKSHYKV